MSAYKWLSNIDYSLYLVTDRDCLQGKDLFESVSEAIKGGVTVVQLREKDATSREFFNIGLKLKKITTYYNVPLIINDRVDIALALDADGVHVGQDDLQAKLVRKLIGNNKIIGVSTKTKEQAKKASLDGANYLGVGAVFPTFTKKDASELNFDEITNICKAVDIPVLGIGGINLENVSELNKIGLDGICVVSAILNKQDCRLCAGMLKQSFKNKKNRKGDV